MDSYLVDSSHPTNLHSPVSMGSYDTSEGAMRAVAVAARRGYSSTIYHALRYIFDNRPKDGTAATMPSTTPRGRTAPTGRRE
jgi:hypothetical protein